MVKKPLQVAREFTCDNQHYTQTTSPAKPKHRHATTRQRADHHRSTSANGACGYLAADAEVAEIEHDPLQRLARHVGRGVSAGQTAQVGYQDLQREPAGEGKGLVDEAIIRSQLIQST